MSNIGLLEERNEEIHKSELIKRVRDLEVKLERKYREIDLLKSKV
jgi:hypothetical protein